MSRSKTTAAKPSIGTRGNASSRGRRRTSAKIEDAEDNVRQKGSPNPAIESADSLVQVLMPALLRSSTLTRSAEAEPDLDQMSDADFLDENAPEIVFAGDAACGSGLEIEDEDLRDEQLGEIRDEVTEAHENHTGADIDRGPVREDSETTARRWLALRIKLKARRIAGLPDDAILEIDESAAFDRLREAIALEATIRAAIRYDQ